MRRGHKRMELVRMADRNKRRRDDDRPADETFLTRRMFLFKGMFATSFTALVAKLGKMQMVDASDYEAAAEGNVGRTENLRAPRGMIVDRAGIPVAENRISWAVSIVPAQVPRDESRRNFIREQLIEALGLPEMLVVRRSALPAGDEDAVLHSLAEEIGEDPVQFARTVRRQSSDYVAIRDELAPADIIRLNELGKRLPGVHVMNEIDYLLNSNAGIATPVVIKSDIPKEIALALEANRVYLPGVQVSDDLLVRRYTGGPTFSHILGYVGPINQEEYEAERAQVGGHAYLPDDQVGRGGVEESMESVLRGSHGIRWYNADARGVEISEMIDRRREPQPGLTVQLTLDREFQQAVTDALQAGIDEANKAALEEDKDPVGSGVAVAMDPQTGEVLALVSLPSFDNQLFVDGISQAQYEELLNNPFKPLTNMAVSGVFPPGSTIKPLYACAALHEQTIDTSTHYRCLGSMRVPTVDDEQGGNFYVCWHQGHGDIAIYDAIAESCDIFFYNVGAPGQTPEGSDEPLHYYIPGDPSPHYFEGMGIELMERYLKEEFGFGSLTGIELAHEAEGVVPNPTWLLQSPLREYWSVGDTINVSIGQGHLSCTPLQLACSVAAIANGGTYFRPRLVKALLDGDGQLVQEMAPESLWQLGITPEHIEVARESMRQTVTDGTGEGKFIKCGSEITVAAKTGTAEFGEGEIVEGRETIKYAKQHAWTTAFAPYDSPRIAVAVLLIGGGEGSTFAAPVADAIIAAYLGKTEDVTV